MSKFSFGMLKCIKLLQCSTEIIYLLFSELDSFLVTMTEASPLQERPAYEISTRSQESPELLVTASRTIESIFSRSSALNYRDLIQLKDIDLLVNLIKPLHLLRHSHVDARRLIDNIEYYLYSSGFDIRRPGELVEELILSEGKNTFWIEVIGSTSNILTCMKELRAILERENICGQSLKYQSTFSNSEYTFLNKNEDYIEVLVQCYRTNKYLSDDFRQYFASNTADEIQEIRNRLKEYQEMRRHNKALSRQWIQETLRLVACALIRLSTDSSKFNDIENEMKDLQEFSKMLLSFKLSELLMYSKEILPYLNDVIAALDSFDDAAASSIDETSKLMEVLNQLAHICAKQVTGETRGSSTTFCEVVEVKKHKILVANNISNDTMADWLMKFNYYHSKQEIISKWSDKECPVCLENEKFINEKGTDWAVFPNCMHLLCLECMEQMIKLKSE